MTQTWLTDEASNGDRLTYEAVFCLACSQQHFICVATGRALGDNVEAVTAIHGPTFPPKAIQKCHDRVATSHGVESRWPPAMAEVGVGGHRKLH
jgi:hypothetical protein